MPGTYGTSLLRNHSLRGVFEKMSAQGFPEKVAHGIRDSADCNLYFFENQVEVPVMYIVLIGAIAVLLGLYVLINLLKKRKRSESK